MKKIKYGSMNSVYSQVHELIDWQHEAVDRDQSIQAMFDQLNENQAEYKKIGYDREARITELDQRLNNHIDGSFEQISEIEVRIAKLSFKLGELEKKLSTPPFIDRSEPDYTYGYSAKSDPEIQDHINGLGKKEE